jgi:uncharacterized repeat protein (TIGR01451 family)
VASETTAHAGDTIIYRILLTVSGSTASNVQVTDTLPAQVDFVALGQPSPAVAGETMRESGSVATWAFPSLSPGVYQLPYTVTIPTTLTEQTVLLNNAQVAYLGGQPQSITAPVTVVFPINVQVAVYNSAGELVKTLLNQNFAQAIQSFQVSSALLTDQISSIAVSILGAPAASWNGTSQNGTLVSNGQYYINVQSTNSLGAVTTVTKTVTVSRSLSTLSVAVYNEAGEVVKHLYQALVPTGSNTIQSLVLSSKVISPGGPANSTGTVTQTTIQVAMSSGGVTVVWDGSNDAGSIVTNGQYFVEANWVNDGVVQTIIQNVTVLNSGGGLAQGQVIAQPNLLVGGQTTTLLKVNSTLRLTLTARFYAISGELVGTAQGLPGTNQVSWDAAGVASGFYLAVVELHDSEGMIGRQIIHLIVRH